MSNLAQYMSNLGQYIIMSLQGVDWEGVSLIGGGGGKYSGTAVYDLVFFSSFWRAISCGR